METQVLICLVPRGKLISESWSLPLALQTVVTALWLSHAYNQNREGRCGSCLLQSKVPWISFLSLRILKSESTNFYYSLPL